MGLFDRLTGHTAAPLSPQAGLLLAAITMMAADGDVDDDELAVIRRLDGSGSTAAWESALKAYKARSIGECVDAATASMNAEQKLMAVSNLIDIAMADGVLAGQERLLLEHYVSAFGVPEQTVSRIVEVIAIKNNRTLFER